MPDHPPPRDPTISSGAAELDFSSPSSYYFEALSRDRIPVRSMTEADLDRLITIDRRATGQDRTTYYQRKFREALHESGVRVSLIAELDGHAVGFIMARVDFGEFGQADSEAVVDTAAPRPKYQNQAAHNSSHLENHALARFVSNYAFFAGETNHRR